MQRVVNFLDTYLPKQSRVLRSIINKYNTLANKPSLALGTCTSTRLNWLVERMPKVESYLEVGILKGDTLEAINVAERWGVDPLPRFNTRRLPEGVRIFPLTSDEFFSKLDNGQKFELIFLDGLHEYKQTYRDTINSLRHLSPGGILIMDDVVPCDEISAKSDQEDSYRERRKMGSAETASPWHGDVFKVLAVLRDCHPELTFRVINESQENPQAVIWRNGDPSRFLENSPETGVWYQSLTYREVFKGGNIPEWFSPGSQTEVLTMALSHAR